MNEQEIRNAIYECEQLPESLENCKKLATFYILLDHVEAEKPEKYIIQEKVVSDYGDSEFFQLIKNRPVIEIWPIIGEAIEGMQVLCPRLYQRLIERLSE